MVTSPLYIQRISDLGPLYLFYCYTVKNQYDFFFIENGLFHHTLYPDGSVSPSTPPIFSPHSLHSGFTPFLSLLRKEEASKQYTANITK